METEVKYDLDLIEFKFKEKYERSIHALTQLRFALSEDDGTECSKVKIEHWEQHVGAELASSIQATDRLADPDDDTPRYMYDDMGACSFMLNGVRFIVADLRDMRADPTVNKERYFDVCCVICGYHHDDDDTARYEFVKDAWLYGSTTDNFDKYHPVHDYFIKKCTEFIESHGGAAKLIAAQKKEEVQ